MEDFLAWAGYGIPALFGLFLGSFANVCILRIPKEESVLRPGSHCPGCGRPIPWYDNIPLLSFLILRGRCRRCRRRISLFYPMGEAAGGLILTLAWWRAAFSPAAGGEAGDIPIRFAFLSYLWLDLWILSWIDAKHRIIPDSLSLPLLPAGLLFRYLPLFLTSGGETAGAAARLAPLREALLGAGVGGGILAALAWAGRRIYKKEAMGMGDVKLMLGAGAFLGPAGTAWALGIASLLGGLWAIALVLLRKKRWREEIPFGPFLASGIFLATL